MRAAHPAGPFRERPFSEGGEGRGERGGEEGREGQGGREGERQRQKTQRVGSTFSTCSSRCKFGFDFFTCHTGGSGGGCLE